MSTFTRAFALEDISIRAGGDGRTVEAYAAVFNTPTEIQDFEGHYLERISPTAFDKTLAENSRNVRVFYNHEWLGSQRAVPIGSPLEMRADNRGLLTVSRYNKTDLADQVLEAIKNGDITGQSFSGRFIQSDTATPRGGFRPKRDGSLTTVTRTEIALREYGPTPFPAYPSAVITGTRTAEEIAESISGLSEDERAALIRLLSATRDDGPAESSDTANPGGRHGEPEPAAGHHSGQSLSRIDARRRLIKIGILHNGKETR